MDAGAQAEVDALARSLGRGVSVDDPHGALLGHSAQHPDVDRARITSILTRQVPAAVRAWQDAHDIGVAQHPVRIPSNPALGMAARVCAPVRSQGRLLAHLWVLEDGRELDPAETDAVDAAAQRLAALLPAPTAPTAGRDADRLLADVLGSTAPARPVARLRALLGDVDVRVVVVAPARADRSPGALPAIGGLRTPPLPRTGRIVARAVTDRRVTAVLTGAAPVAPVFDTFRRAWSTTGICTVAGISGPVTVDRLRTALDQAEFAARCAGVDPALPETSHWADLRVYRELLDPPASSPPTADPADGGDADTVTPMLLHTLEVYLDHAGDAQRTAAALNLHRTSLYYRLGRISALLHVELDDGLTRTQLHVALKRRRLQR